MANELQNDFLDHVYDRYETRDFYYGKPELNPIREVSTYEILSQQDIESRMMARIQERMQKIIDESIRQQLAKRRKSSTSGIGAMIGDGQTSLNFGNFGMDIDSGAAGMGINSTSIDMTVGVGRGGVTTGRRVPNAVGAGETLTEVKDNPRFREKIVELGGDPSSGMLMDFAPSPHNPVQPPLPIEMSLLPIFVAMPKIPDSLASDSNPYANPYLDSNPFVMDCDDIIQEGSGSSSGSSGSSGSGTGSGSGSSSIPIPDWGFNPYDPNANPGDGYYWDGSRWQQMPADGDGGDDQDTGETFEGSGEEGELDDEVNNELDGILDRLHDDLAKQDLALFECAAVDVVFFIIILAILKVIKIFKTIIDMVLALLLPIISIVQLAVGAWLNPSNIAKIAQLIVMKVISIVVMLITMIIQMIWNMLNLDCVASTTQKVIDEIKKTLSGLNSAVSMANGQFINTELKKVNDKILSPLAAIRKELDGKIEAWKSADSAFNEMMKGLSKETLEATLSSAVQGAVSPFVSRITGVRNNAMSLVPAAAQIQTTIKSEKDRKAAQKQIERTKTLSNNILKGPSGGLTSHRVSSLRTS